jgi:hypothetical protein
MQDSTYVMAQIAIAFHNMRQVDQAVEYFKQLSEVDPFRYLFSIRIRAVFLTVGDPYSELQIRIQLQAFW